MSTIVLKKKLVDRLGNVSTLRTLPGVVHKICLMVESKESSSAELGRLISKDQVITARVLRLINSSFYGFPNRIATITQSLVLLGFTVMKGILLGISIVDDMKRGMTGLWEHSLACSMAAGIIARKIEEPDPEEAQVAGLLHDLGKVVIALEFPEEYAEIQRKVHDGGLSFLEAERAVFGGESHLDVNGYFCKEWNIPARLSEAITLYSAPPPAGRGARMAAIVGLADTLVQAAGFGFSGDRRVPEILSEDVARLGLDETSMREIVCELIEELDSLDVAELSG